jgi:hypothetical protein
MRTLLAASLIGMAFLVSCAPSPTVVQGTVVSSDTAQRIVVIQDQAKPGVTLEFSFEGAEVGAKPNPGDIIRVAYLTQNGKLKATRIMNISRQKDLKGGK